MRGIGDGVREEGRGYRDKLWGRRGGGVIEQGVKVEE